MKKILLSRFIILPVVFMLLSIPLFFVSGKVAAYLQGSSSQVDFTLSQKILYCIGVLSIWPVALIDSILKLLWLHLGMPFIDISGFELAIHAIGWGILGLLIAYILHLKDRLTSRSKGAV